MKTPSNTRQPAVTDPLDSGPPRPERKSLRLGMLHYHLRPGGVTSVMREMAAALARHSGYDPLEIDVFAAVGSEARARKIFAGSGKSNLSRLRVASIPSLAYRKEPYPDRSSFIKAAEKTTEDILSQIDLSKSGPECPYILHSHNISIGKNPAATMALKIIAEKAAARSLPLWLINQVHDFAENNRSEQVRAFYRCAGSRDEAFARSFMYPNTPNVIYATINSADMENLRKIGIASDRIFLLPDPIDAHRCDERPLWEKDGRKLAALGLESADYRETMLARIADYASSKNQVFDPSLPILLSPLKVMRRKNNIESILFLILLKHLGRRYQLLISLDANSPPDIAYSQRLKQFAASRDIPVVVGFGRETISEAGPRKIRNGVVKQYGICDLFALCSAVVTTSVVEGFGIAYHEGWLAGKPVIGRKVGEIVRDFEDNGMRFDHTYERLAVAVDDVPHLRKRLREAYRKKIFGPDASPKRSALLTHAKPDDIIESKLFRVGAEDCIDFADLSLEMQIELLDRLRDKRELADRLIERNPAIGASFEILENLASEPVESLIESNRAVIRARYSLEAMARRLEILFATGDLLYREECERVPLSRENHAAVMRRYRVPEHMRLIF